MQHPLLLQENLPRNGLLYCQLDDARPRRNMDDRLLLRNPILVHPNRQVPQQLSWFRLDLCR